MQYKRLRKRWKGLLAAVLAASMAVPVGVSAQKESVPQELVELTEETTEPALEIEEIDSVPDLARAEDTIEKDEDVEVELQAEVYEAEKDTDQEVDFSYVEVEEIPDEVNAVNQEESAEEEILEEPQTANTESEETQEVPAADTDTEQRNIMAAEAPQSAAAALARVKTGWNLINGTWYYYKSDGTKQTGWVHSGNYWYYLDPATGAMKADQIITSGGEFYHLKTNGTMSCSTWVSYKGIWYYASAGGALVRGWLKVGNDWYYTDPSTAKMQTYAVISSGNKKYFVNGSGRMVKNSWGKDREENWYYAGADGVLVAGWQKIGGEWYYLDKTTFIMKKNVILKSGSKMYLMTGSGAMAVNEWAKVEDHWYHADGNGLLQTGWLYTGGNWYWLGTDGCMQTGWITVGGKQYYMNDSGAMLKDWQKINGKWYFFDKSNGAMAKNSWIKSGDKTTWLWVGADGVMVTGWNVIDNKHYYMDANGYVQKGWLKYNNNWYWLGTDGVMVTGWEEISNQWYYFKSWGGMATGWMNVNGTYYYFNSSGAMQTGWVKDKGISYYLEEDGSMATGWKKLNNKWYYFKYWGGMATGWVYIDGTYYYCNSSGVMQTGWLTEDGCKYYLDSSGKMAVGWKTVDGYERYFNKWGVMQTNTTIDGKYLDSQGRYIPPKVEAGKKTIKNFLRTAIQPVGECLYVWGGGHDNFKGGDALRIGVNPQWKTFYTKQGADYDYTQHRYEYGNGLDCSGYVGWAVYNIMNTKSDNVAGCTTTTSTITPAYLSEKGWGTYKKTKEGKFETGDVVSMNGHVWIVIGQCDDGSVVIVHATPPVVQISGTVTPDGKTNSQAVTLANKYMKTYYPDAAGKYRLSIGSKSYLYGTNLQGANRFQWNTTSGAVKDPDGYKNMDVDDILYDLFCGK